jgi:hypothetical protein
MVAKKDQIDRSLLINFIRSNDKSYQTRDLLNFSYTELVILKVNIEIGLQKSISK